MTALKLDWCSYEAAKYAVMNWHYSKSMPAGKTVKIGVWESEDRSMGKWRFIGAVIFSRGANKDLGTPYGYDQLECCELTRVALDKHAATVTKIVAIAIKMLKKANAGIRLIISFADPERDHIGAIYQAGNWLYVGMSIATEEYIVNGKRMHGRSMRAMYGTHLGKDFIKVIKGSSKHRYLMPLDNEVKSGIKQYSKPFPKRVKQAIVSCPENCDGVAPIHTLQNSSACNGLTI